MNGLQKALGAAAFTVATAAGITGAIGDIDVYKKVGSRWEFVPGFSDKGVSFENAGKVAEGKVLGASRGQGSIDFKAVIKCKDKTVNLYARNGARTTGPAASCACVCTRK